MTTAAKVEQARAYINENLLVLAQACVDAYLAETPETETVLDLLAGDDQLARHLITKAATKAFIEQEQTIADLEAEREGLLEQISELNERAWLED